MDLLRRTRERLYLQRKICGILFMLAENNGKNEISTL